jgi:hypothetical protein
MDGKIIYETVDNKKVSTNFAKLGKESFAKIEHKICQPYKDIFSSNYDNKFAVDISE